MTVEETKSKKQAKNSKRASEKSSKTRTGSNVKKSKQSSKRTTNATQRKRPAGSDQRRPKPQKTHNAKRRKTNATKKKKPNKKMKNKVVTALFDLLFFVFIIFMLGGAAIFTISEKNDKSFYGYRFYEVYTNSMRKIKKEQTGNFIAGDMIIVKIEASEKVKVGDIITFVPNQQSPDTYLTHRVIAKEEPEEPEEKIVDGNVKTTKNYPVFTTQGDANNLADPPVTGDRVVGVVKLAIPKAGKLLKLIRNHTIPVVIIVASFFLLVILLRQYFAPEIEENTQKNRYNSLPATKKKASKGLYK